MGCLGKPFNVDNLRKALVLSRGGEWFSIT
jgi:hypothetical protein